MAQEKNIFVVGGGTGGHLFPALSVGQRLMKRGYKVHLITDDRCVKYLPKDHSEFIVHIINSSGFKSGILSKIIAMFMVLSSIVRTFALMIKYKPSIVATFGGYMAFSPLLCANLLRIPTVIHEQNCFFGKVNKWFASRAKNIVLTFKETKNVPSGNEEKIIVTGNPVREEIRNAKIEKDFYQNPFKIVVIGGSQGAKVFSELVPKALELIIKKYPDFKLEVIQQAKSEDIKKIQSIYDSYNIKSNISDFFYNIPELLSDSHIVIARSGASTIAELIELAKPAFFIPYPFASEKHQHFNADIISKNQGGWWVDQDIVTSQMIADKISEVYQNRDILVIASNKLSHLQNDSANIIANSIEKIIAS